MVFKTVAVPVERSNASDAGSTAGKAIKTKADLEAELGDDVNKIRKNEGEAAQYGVFYDDTEYDYMQHLREFGTMGDAHIVLTPEPKQKKKNKQSLDEALRTGIPPPDSLLPKDILPSEENVKRTYQDQQNIPDAIAGFQPDMDWKLREALEALEDDAYVAGDDDEEDIFAELAKSGEVDDIEEVEDEDEDGYESDATARPASPGGAGPQEGGAAEEGDWMQQFSKYKKDLKKSKDVDVESSIGGDSMMSARTDMTSASSRRRRRKGRAARSESSGYSMTSSSLLRTEGLTLLDSRFEKIEEEYAEDEEDYDDNDGLDITGKNLVPETRKDFDSILDEFLESHNTKGRAGKKVVRRGKQKTGLEDLAEIRQQLRV